MTIPDVLDELTYRSYRVQRRAGVTPAQWAAAVDTPDLEAMERRYQRERVPTPTCNHVDGPDEQPCGKPVAAQVNWPLAEPDYFCQYHAARIDQRLVTRLDEEWAAEDKRRHETIERTAFAPIPPFEVTW